MISLSTKSITVAKNDFIKLAGSVDTHVYHIEEGNLRIYVLDGEEEQIIRFGSKGNLIVLDSYLTGQPCNFMFMVNVVGFCDNFISAGQSTVWNKD